RTNYSDPEQSLPHIILRRRLNRAGQFGKVTLSRRKEGSPLCKLTKLFCKLAPSLCKLTKLSCKLAPSLCKLTKLLCKLAPSLCKLAPSLCKLTSSLCKLTKPQTIG